jgi:hypothetical protein
MNHGTILLVEGNKNNVAHVHGRLIEVAPPGRAS